MKKLLLFILPIILLVSCRYYNDASDTAYREFKPSTLLQKYEDFKDEAAKLDADLATISTYDSKLSSIKEGYGADSNNRKVWSRDDREQYSIWLSEQQGIKSSYNDLASDYNANMAKFNYSFCNVGTLPQGATEPLPREFKPYIYN